MAPGHRGAGERGRAARAADRRPRADGRRRRAALGASRQDGRAVDRRGAGLGAGRGAERSRAWRPDRPMKTGPSGALAQRFLTSKITPLLIGASLLAGVGGLLTTPREEEPQIRVPMIDVAAGLPGASPREVERRIAEPLERAIWEIPGIDYVYSASYPDGALVTAR